MSTFDHLVGRKYKAGSEDCYGLCRDYYREFWGIDLPNFARPDEFWLDPNLDLYRQYTRFGFQLVEEDRPQIGDAFLMPIGTQVNTHAAVMVEPNKILHHLPDRFSVIDPLKPKWWSRVTVHLRHPDITKQLKKNQPEVQLHDTVDHPLLSDPEVKRAIERLERDGR